jgi:hypothetical protein
MKHSAQSFWTEEGMQIASSAQHPEKAKTSIHESREPASNVTFDRPLHPRKHWDPSVWKEEGMQIDESDALRENAALPIFES